MRLEIYERNFFFMRRGRKNGGGLAPVFRDGMDLLDLRKITLDSVVNASGVL